uniref:Uncharacterized protein n=1 Tax=Cacopsylla melanoneura TaxID=428564 RepID=A0A8D9A1N5_9HEMI
MNAWKLFNSAMCNIQNSHTAASEFQRCFFIWKGTLFRILEVIIICPLQALKMIPEQICSISSLVFEILRVARFFFLNTLQSLVKPFDFTFHTSVPLQNIKLFTAVL